MAFAIFYAAIGPGESWFFGIDSKLVRWVLFRSDLRQIEIRAAFPPLMTPMWRNQSLCLVSLFKI